MDTDGEDGGGGPAPPECEAVAALAGEARLFLTFDEGDPARVGDASPDGREGVVVGSVSYEAGRCGRAVAFDGTRSWVEVAPDPVLDGAETGLTVEAWVWLREANDYSMVLAKRSRMELGKQSFQMIVNADGEASTFSVERCGAVARQTGIEVGR